MIELKVQDYCHGCPYFKPEMNESVWDEDGIFSMAVNQYVYCDKAALCTKIAEHIEKKLKVEK